MKRYFDRPNTPLRRAVPFLSEENSQELLELKASLNIEELFGTKTCAFPL